MAEVAINWFTEELEAMRPPERIKISEWAETRRILGAHSAIKGPYQCAMVPFFIPIMDSCQEMNIDEVVLCKPAQIGGTTAFLNVVGYYSDQDPSPIMVILADELTAGYVATKQIHMMYKDSMYLRRLYNPNDFNKTEINLPNAGYVAITWASSVAQLATRSMRIVIFDEIDKPGYYVTTRESDAISLGRERTDTYPQGYSKHILTSTPTLEDGNITKELYSCDIIFDWHVPCPHCNQFQPLRWSPDPEHTYGFKDCLYRGNDGKMHKFGGVVWEGGRNATNKQIKETARYACGECGALWTTQQKNDAVRKGKMVPRTQSTGYERKIGYHVNRIYSLFDGGRLEKLIRRWRDVFKKVGERHQKALQGFINSALAEPWKEVMVTSTETRVLKARCELLPQMVPQEAVALTAGVDVQKRGFWFVVRAFARDYTNWLIHYGYLSEWLEVENLLFETAYPIETDGDEGQKYMRIWRAGIDTGGGEGEDGVSMTEATYFWLRKNAIGRGCRVWGTKGSSRPLAGKVHVGKALDKTPSGKPIPGGLQIILLDTEKGKDMVYYRLEQAINGDLQGSYLHRETNESYVRQILAEEKQRDRKGLEKWVKVRTDNHYLDCEVICQLLAEPEWPGGGVNLIRPASPRRSDRSENRKHGSGWLPKKGNGWLGKG